MNYKVDLSNNGEFAFKAKAQNMEITIDTKGSGITPPEAFLASIGSCIGVYLRRYVSGAHLALGAFNISVSADMTNEAPFCFRQINVVIDLKGAQIEDRRKKVMLEFIKNCPIHNTLKVNPDINVSIT